MGERTITGERCCLRIYLGEEDKLEGKPLWRELLERARRQGVAGCTVLNGILAFGSGHQIHSDFPPDTAVSLPMLIEIVDDRDLVARFLAEIGPIIGESLITEERAFVHYYQPGRDAKET